MQTEKTIPDFNATPEVLLLVENLKLKRRDMWLESGHLHKHKYLAEQALVLNKINIVTEIIDGLEDVVSGRKSAGNVQFTFDQNA